MLIPDDLSAALTRRELNVTLEGLKKLTQDYINKLYDEISSRMNHCDFGGTTAWSEAPAEGIFSIWKQILSGSESLSIENTEDLGRIMHDGPKPATVDAENLMLSASTKWPADQGCSTATVEFITKDWQVRFIQSHISVETW